MSTPKTARRTHWWLSPENVNLRERLYVRPWLLTRARFAGEVDTATLAPVYVSGYLLECRHCGAVTMHGQYIDDHGDRRPLLLYGFDVESLAPMQSPACLDLQRPGRPLDEDDDDNAAAAPTEAA